MKKFILKTILFLLPVILFYAFPMSVVFLSKEYYTVDHVVSIQNSTKDTLYGNTYNTGSFIPYKELLVKTNSPTVFSLGSSRTSQIRKEFFLDPKGFINAGLAGRSIGDMKYFVESQATSTPKVLLLVLDREMFLQDPTQSDARTDDYVSLFGLNFHLPLDVARGMYLDYFLRHKYSFSGLVASSHSQKTLGLRAFADGNGFRPDGSYSNNKESQDKDRVKNNAAQADVVAKNILNDQGVNSSADDKKISANLGILNEVLALSKLKNITVVGFIPPYMSAINKATYNKDAPESLRYVDMVNSVDSEFRAVGFSFYDLSDISKYGGTDSEFIDTVHGTDLMYAKISLYLAMKDKTMSAYFDANELKKIISEARGDFLAF